MRIESKAAVAVASSGLAWGLLWMPLRRLNHAGLEGVWPIALFSAIPALIALPFAIRRWPYRPILHVLGIATALPLVLYGLSVTQTTVVRAMLLFYLAPVWSLFLARAFLAEAITATRIAAVVLAAVGIVLVTGTPGDGVRLNSGDILALLAGMGWSGAMLLLRLNDNQSAVDLSVQNLVWTGIVALLAIPIAVGLPAPPLPLLTAQLPWLIPVAALVAIPSVFLAMWGAPKLSPAVSSLLYMTEIAAGAVSAALWAGERFGWHEAAGIALIASAGAAEFIFGKK
jgi:drug/metabolite transporter (DMT)-like permease